MQLQVGVATHLAASCYLTPYEFPYQTIGRFLQRLVWIICSHRLNLVQEGRIGSQSQGTLLTECQGPENLEEQNERFVLELVGAVEKEW